MGLVPLRCSRWAIRPILRCLGLRPLDRKIESATIQTATKSRDLKSHASHAASEIATESPLNLLGNESIYLHRSGPLLDNDLDRPKYRYGRYGFPSFYSISISTVGVDGARVCL